MTAGDATALVDVAHEGRWRRWAIADAPTPVEWRTDAGEDALSVGPGTPVRVAILGPQAGQLDHATRRVTLAAGVEVVLDLRPTDDRPFGERAQALRSAHPNIVLVPLADRDGAERLAILAEALRFGCSAQRPRPRVLLATADETAIDRASLLLSPFPVEVLPDIRRDEGRERAVTRLRDARRDRGVLRDQALEAIARAIALAQRAAALVVDVTGGSTSIVRADPIGHVAAVHVRPLGVGRGADHVVARAGLDRVRRWIPWTVDAPTLLERVFNRARWPDAVSAERETLALEIALAHEAIGHALADAAAAGIGLELRSAPAVFLTGRLAAIQGSAMPVLVALDALGLIEPASIGRDEDDLAVAVAAAAIAANATSALPSALALGAVALAGVVPVPGPKRSLVRILAGAEVRDETVQPGAFYVVPVRGEVDVGVAGAPPARVAAGSLGVIVDARRRPLSLPVRDAERVPAVAGWYDALGAMPAPATVA
ncbi:MAG: hypothetical protein A2082_07210 [Chloroflexi bacterium GWC2_70_10]|nr:MAG: hypothetical protein A2082_07210 [Chloroflexi bacterium GWC2_70_10]